MCIRDRYKITPDMFGSWMKILSQVENSYLWIATENQVVMTNLRSEAEKRGISNSRLIFAPRMTEKSDHMARIKLANLFLDTFPFNAHTTASDALRAGLPLLTLPGNSFASRVSASMLKNLNLQELIANSTGDYESIAISLANNPIKLEEIREKLFKASKTASIFNTDAYIKKLESAYQNVYQRSMKGLPPVSITINN